MGLEEINYCVTKEELLRGELGKFPAHSPLHKYRVSASFFVCVCENMEDFSFLFVFSLFSTGGIHNYSKISTL